MTGGEYLFRLKDGLHLIVGTTTYVIPKVRVTPGNWITFIPETEVYAADPSGDLSRVLISLTPPKRGSVEILGVNTGSLSYRESQRLRSRIGFIQGFGGLLANRTVRDNIRLPLTVHGGLDLAQEERVLDKIIHRFSLDGVQHLRPHHVDGFSRWRACVARALVLKPRYVVLENIGDWAIDNGEGIAWKRLVEYHRRGDNLIIICQSRPNVGFERWFETHGGVVIKYARRGTDVKGRH